MIRRGEAVEGLRRLRGIVSEATEGDEIYADYAEVIDIAIKAVQKQTPMKPYRNIVHYPYRTDMEVVQCPNCKRRLRTSRTTKSGDAYCPDCGQAIDWDPEEPRLQADTLLTEEVQNGGSE